MIKEKKKYGPLGEVVAKDDKLDIYLYKNKIGKVCEELSINVGALEKAIKAIKSREEFNSIYNIDSKVRTIYEIKSYQEKEKKEEKQKEKGKILNNLKRIDKELIKAFKDREIVKKEEIEKVLSKYGLTLDESLHLSAIYNLEFASEFYEAEKGVFKRIS